MQKAMEQVCKGHYKTFKKHLLLCDPTIGVKFFHKIQFHNDGEVVNIDIFICFS